MIRVFRLTIIFIALLLLLPSCGGGSHSIFGPCLCGGVTRGFIYTANSAGNPSTVSALLADTSTGSLSQITGSPYNTGSGSVALAIASAQFLYVANSFSGDISVFSMSPGTGGLSPIGASSVSVEAGVDAIAIDYRFKSLYAVSGNSANLYAFSIGSAGDLTPIGVNPTLIAAGTIQSSAIAIDPSGKYVYVTARDSTSASIYGFTRDTTTGALTAMVNFPIAVDGLANSAVFDPTGHFLLITGTDVFGLKGGIDVFSLDSNTGSLTLTAQSPVQVGTDPSAIAIDPPAHFVYVANTADATISAFAFDSTSGNLTPVAGSPFPSGGHGSINGPQGITTDGQGKFVFVCNASNDISVFSAASGVLTPVTGSPFPDGGSGPHAIAFVL